MVLIQEQKAVKKMSEFTALGKSGPVIALVRTEYLDRKEQRLWVVTSTVVNGTSYPIELRYWGHGDEDNIQKRCEELEKEQIEDYTEKGYYCCQCGEFADKAIMQSSESLEIRRFDGEPKLIKTHYDGCRGWS